MSLVLDTPESGPCTRAQAFDRNLIPISTTTYQAVSNEELLLMLNDAARQHGLILTDEQLGLDRKGMRFFGTYEIEGKDFFGGRSKLMMGFCNSGNKTLRVRVCFGGKVFVCSNLCFSHWTDEETGIGGDVAHKHTTHVTDGLWQRLTQALSSVDSFRTTQEDFYSRLAETMISDDEASGIILRAGREGIVGSPKLVSVLNEWNNQERYPDTETEALDWHPEFRKRNAFNLLNAFTEVEKSHLAKNPVSSNLGTLNLTNYFYNEFISQN